jgi:hypothetical protein
LNLRQISFIVSRLYLSGGYSTGSAWCAIPALWVGIRLLRPGGTREVLTARTGGINTPSSREDAHLLKRYRDMGVERVVTILPPEPAHKTLPVLDRWAALIRGVNA